ncbi:MAG: hypothetical protein KAR76_03600 [Methanosarcinales archaeon]|nr:hypothetical protein [Methanosarcinales archaeon]
MKDSKGNQISIGDRVKVLWGFDNKIHSGKIIKIRNDVVTIKSMGKRVLVSDHNKITKIPGSEFELI